MKRRYIYRAVLIGTAALLSLSSCATNRKQVVYEAPEPVIEEVIVEEQLEPVYKAPEPVVREADEFVWSSILAMQNMKKETEETAPEPLEEAVIVEELPAAEEAPVETEADESKNENNSDEVIRLEAEEAALVPDETEEDLPDVTVLDLIVAEENPEMVRVGTVGEEAPAVAAEEPVVTVPEMEEDGRILQTDASALSWLEEAAAESGEEPPAESGPINVSIYEYKPEPAADDGVKPEDILALSEAYTGNREEKKKASEMEKSEIITLVVSWLVANYRYFLLAGIIIVVILLVKVLVKTMKRTAKKKKEKVQGPEFTEDDSMIVINPMEEGNLSEFIKPEEPAEREKDEPAAPAGSSEKKPPIKPVNADEERLMDRITRDENGDILLRGGDLTPEDAMRLAVMGLAAAEGEDDDEDEIAW